MTLTLPTSLSPSKVSAFKDCALAFRYSVIDRLPEPPSPWTVKGTLVHRTLEKLFCEEPPGRRTPEAAYEKLARALLELHDEIAVLGLSDEETAEFEADAHVLLDAYFVLEDPNEIRVVGTELWLEAQVGTLTLRGIIDRLELDADGELVVTDYKTGKAPYANYEQSRLGGVHFYAFLCDRVLGRRPVRVQLLYLRDPVAISTVPTEQSVRGLQNRALALWTAVERACETGNFKPKPSKLCDYCAYRAMCPAWSTQPAG